MDSGITDGVCIMSQASFLKLFGAVSILAVLSCGGNAFHSSESSGRKEQNTAVNTRRVTSDGAELKLLGDGFVFTEGPAVTPEGTVFFTDSRGGKLFHWSPESGVRQVEADSLHAVGTYVDRDGAVIACSGRTRKVLALHRDGTIRVIAGEFEGKRFNGPNDLWIDPRGGIYFTDPDWGRRPSEIGGGRVFYITPDRQRVIPVIEDIQIPNGIVGNAEGTILYVADNKNHQTFAWTINPDGTLRDKRLFAPYGFDGLTIDREGNVYITVRGEEVLVFNPAGTLIETIPVPQTAANLCFGGPDNRTLFLACGTGFYSLHMRVAGVDVFR